MSAQDPRYMFEGYGGPVNVNRADLSGIDPTLEACCQREVGIIVSLS